MLLLYLFENLQFAGHCYQAVKELILFLILWYPVGRVHSCKLTYPNLIARVSGLDTRELSTVMVNLDFWTEISKNVLSTLVVEGRL